MNKNRQLVEELNRELKQGGGRGKGEGEGGQGRDLLKNVNHHRSPTYLHIDYGNKDKEESLQFAKKASKKEDPIYFTPKIDKGKIESRFNSSPLI